MQLTYVDNAKEDDVEIKTIVVGVDFAPEADLAVQEAMMLARHTGAKVVLVHAGTVVDHQASGGPAIDAEWQRIAHEELGKDRERLEQMRERFEGQGPEVSHAFIDGFPDSGLIDAAKELGADVTVTGTHGRTGLKRFFLGSVAERVARLSPNHVLIARGDVPMAGYKRILVPTDFTEFAEEAVKMAIVVAAPDATIELLHLWQMPMTGPETAVPAPLADSIEAAAKDAGANLVEKYRRDGVNLSFSVSSDGPAHGILRRLEEDGFDLVVLGSHGRRGLRRWLIGSVAESVARHSPCSVLITHRETKP